MRVIRTIEEAATQIKILTDRLDAIETRNIDLHGRRLVNAGEAVDASDYITQAGVNKLIDPFQSLLTPTPIRENAPPVICKAYQNTLQSVGSGSWTALALDATSIDTQSLHSNVTNNTRITIKTPGYYLVSGRCAFVGSNLGERGVYSKITFAAGGSVQSGYAFQPTAPVSANGMGGIDVHKLAAGDYVEVYSFQSTGGNLNTSPGIYATYLFVVQIL